MSKADASEQQSSELLRLTQAIEANTAAVLKVIEINSTLLQALADLEEEQVEDIEPSHYMDGRKV